MTLGRMLAGAAVLACLMLGSVAAQPPRGKSEGKTPSEQDAKALAHLNRVAGTIVSTSPTDRSFKLRIEYQTVQPRPGARTPTNLRVHPVNPRASNALQQMIRQQQELARLEARQLQALANSYKVVNEHMDFEMVLTPKGNVRYQKIPFEYDDKGFPRKYTTKELEQMKGNDPNLPGYAADFEKLKPGDSVRVTIAHGSDASGDDKDAVKGDKRIKASLILIQEEGPDPNPPKGGKKGK